MSESKLKITMVARQRDARLEGDLTGYIWDNLSIKINDSNTLRPTKESMMIPDEAAAAEGRRAAEDGEAGEGRKEGCFGSCHRAGRAVTSKSVGTRRKPAIPKCYTKVLFY